MNLIGINGYKRSGKGTVATILSENHPGVVYDLGFADKVKIGAMKALGFDRPPRDLIALADEFKLDGPSGAQIGVHYTESDGSRRFHDLDGRQLLQWFGTEVGRELFGSDFWVDQVLPRPVQVEPEREDRDELERHVNNGNLQQRYPEIDVVAITDLRFENEAQRILDLGGVIWRVNRPGYGGEGHASEQPLPDSLVTHEIDNSGDLDDLSDEVYVAMQETLGFEPVVA